MVPFRDLPRCADQALPCKPRLESILRWLKNSCTSVNLIMPIRKSTQYFQKDFSYLSRLPITLESRVRLNPQLGEELLDSRRYPNTKHASLTPNQLKAERDRILSLTPLYANCLCGEKSKRSETNCRRSEIIGRQDGVPIPFAFSSLTLEAVRVTAPKHFYMARYPKVGSDTSNI